MHPSRAAACRQHQRIKHYRAHCDGHSFFNVLTSDALLDTVEALSPEAYRERLYPPTETLSMFLAQAMSADRSCQNIVNHTAVQRVCTGLSPVSTHTGAYCRARQRLPLAMLSKLTRHVSARFGSALNLNIHFHILFLDGVYVYRDNRSPRFQRVKAPDKGDLEELVQLISQRIGRCLERQGLLEQDAESAWLDLDTAEDTDAMPFLMGSSVSYRIAIGPQQG